ncbi:MAG: geranylgeranylglycerol-phosphate geranylgeranyltransferase [Cytophagaceae bacterium]|nr:geranylgeranylglycerol-phosphate geranylgeranyltransferase [Cytophagaceae bacterium]
MYPNIKNFARLIRYPNLLIIAVTQLLVRIFLIKNQEIPFYKDYLFLIMVVSTLLVAGSGYIINDYFDVKIDRINKPDEVIVGNTIKRRTALLFHQILSGVALILAFFLGWKTLAINVFSITTLWLYASILKKKTFIGNLIVALLTSLSIAQIAVYFEPDNKLVYIYALFAFFINLIREIIKDIEDIRGDKTHGAKTLPIVYGIRKTKYLIYFLLFVFVVFVILLTFEIGNLKIFTVFSIIGLFIIYLIYKLVNADRKKHFAFLSRWCKIIMLIGMGSIALF